MSLSRFQHSSRFMLPQAATTAEAILPSSPATSRLTAAVLRSADVALTAPTVELQMRVLPAIVARCGPAAAILEGRSTAALMVSPSPHVSDRIFEVASTLGRQRDVEVTSPSKDHQHRWPLGARCSVGTLEEWTYFFDTIRMDTCPELLLVICGFEQIFQANGECLRSFLSRIPQPQQVILIVGSSVGMEPEMEAFAGLLLHQPVCLDLASELQGQDPSNLELEFQSCPKLESGFQASSIPDLGFRGSSNSEPESQGISNSDPWSQGFSNFEQGSQGLPKADAGLQDVSNSDAELPDTHNRALVAAEQKGPKHDEGEEDEEEHQQNKGRIFQEEQGLDQPQRSRHPPELEALLAASRLLRQQQEEQHHQHYQQQQQQQQLQPEDTTNNQFLNPQNPSNSATKAAHPQRKRPRTNTTVVAYDPRKNRFWFTIPGGQGEFQTTVKAAGGMKNAEKMAQLCLRMFDFNASKTEVLEYRNNLYRVAKDAILDGLSLNEDWLASEHAALAAKFGAEPNQENLKNIEVEHFQEEEYEADRKPNRKTSKKVWDEAEALRDLDILAVHLSNILCRSQDPQVREELLSMLPAGYIAEDAVDELKVEEMTIREGVRTLLLQHHHQHHGSRDSDCLAAKDQSMANPSVAATTQSQMEMSDEDGNRLGRTHLSAIPPATASQMRLEGGNCWPEMSAFPPRTGLDVEVGGFVGGAEESLEDVEEKFEDDEEEAWYEQDDDDQGQEGDFQDEPWNDQEENFQATAETQAPDPMSIGRESGCRGTNDYHSSDSNSNCISNNHSNSNNSSSNKNDSIEANAILADQRRRCD